MWIFGGKRDKSVSSDTFFIMHPYSFTPSHNWHLPVLRKTTVHEVVTFQAKECVIPFDVELDTKQKKKLSNTHAQTLQCNPPRLIDSVCLRQPTVRIGTIIYNSAPPIGRYAHAAVFVQTKGMYVLGGTDGQNVCEPLNLRQCGRLCVCVCVCLSVARCV